VPSPLTYRMARHRRPAGLALLPSLGVLAHPLHHALYLPGGDFDATSLSQVTLRLFISGFISPFQTDQRAKAGV